MHFKLNSHSVRYIRVRVWSPGAAVHRRSEMTRRMSESARDAKGAKQLPQATEPRKTANKAQKTLPFVLRVCKANSHKPGGFASPKPCAQKKVIPYIFNSEESARFPARTKNRGFLQKKLVTTSCHIATQVQRLAYYFQRQW